MNVAGINPKGRRKERSATVKSKLDLVMESALRGLSFTYSCKRSYCATTLQHRANDGLISSRTEKPLPLQSARANARQIENLRVPATLMNLIQQPSNLNKRRRMTKEPSRQVVQS